MPIDMLNDLRCAVMIRNTATIVLLMASALHARPVNAQSATWRIAPTPTIRLGVGDAADVSLAAPAGASRLPNGNIVVGDLGEYALKEFALSGKLAKRYGRKGHGPGEISYLAPLLRCGESLVANDIDGLTSIFRPNGTFVRTFRMVPQPYRFRCNARMQFAVMGWSTGVKAGVYRQVAPYWIARADTSAIIPLGDLPGSERMGVPGGDGPYPLGREPRVAIGVSR